MAKLVLLVVAAAWAAVLIPPMLRSRVDNRPNSSVTDFRRQLNRLQSTATPPRGTARAFGRPLAQSPLQRQVAGGRPSQPATRGGGTAVRDRTGETPRMRTHGDPSGGQRRPAHTGRQRRPDSSQGQRRPQEPQARRRQADPNARQAPKRSHDRTDGSRRPASTRRTLGPAAVAKRRRANLLFVLVVTSACTMFLAAMTDSVAMLWAFGVSFLATCGYLYVLARQRGATKNDAAWLEQS